MQKNKILLFIGRFQPFHTGHLKIIKRYHKLGYFLKIGIGSSQKSNEIKNPFTVEERERMIRLSLSEAKIHSYKIFRIPDVPKDNKYAKHVISIVGRFDVLFTGNISVRDCFKTVHASKIHYYNEKIGRLGNISAGKIRKIWIDGANRKYLPSAVYSYLKHIATVDRLREFKDPLLKVHYLLMTNKLKISCAESCTGGNIGRSLITFSGASDFFLGGIIAYNDNIKHKILKVTKRNLEKYGAVSPQVAYEMARNVRMKFKSDYGISSTGYTDPSSKESGVIFIAIASPNSDYVLELRSTLKKREKLISYAVRQAIIFLEKVLEKELLL